MRARVAYIPCGSCSWAVLPEPKGSRMRRQEFAFEFERFLPRPIEEYAYDFATDQSGSIIGCAVRADVALSLCDNADIIRPDRIPYALGVDADPDVFQLARGAYRSMRLTRLSKTAAASMVIVLVGVASTLTTGLILKAERLDGQSALLRNEINATYAHVVPPDADSRQPRAILVQSMLRRVERANQAAVHREVFDVRADVAALLSKWPDMTSLTLERLEIGAAQAKLEVTLAPEADASTFFAMYTAVDGWEPGSPGVRRSRDRQQLTLLLQRTSKRQDQ